MEIGEGVVVGTCRLMCPEKEMKAREATGRLHRLERSNTARNQGRLKVDRELAVKEFSRPAAGKGPVNPCDLRPAPVLRKTVNYLLNSVVSNSELPWFEIYNFVFDRLRSVRQDMVIQCIHGNDAIAILEMNVRFLVYASYRLCSESRDRFDSHINDTHLQECLKRLLVLYSTSDDSSVHQAEFLALYLIINLGSTEAMSLGLQMKSVIGTERVFETALALNLSWYKGNYVRTLRLIRQLPLLHLWATHRHIDSIRGTAMKVMSSAFTSKTLTYPLSSLSDLLLFDSEAEAAQLCTSSGLTLPSDNQVCFSRSNFHQATDTAMQHCRWIDRKAEGISIAEFLQGQSPDDQSHRISSTIHRSSDDKIS